MDLHIIVALLLSETNQEVNEIVNEFKPYLDENPQLYTFVRAARHRIALIRKERKKSWHVYELN